MFILTSRMFGYSQGQRHEWSQIIQFVSGFFKSLFEFRCRIGYSLSQGTDS